MGRQRKHWSIAGSVVLWIYSAGGAAAQATSPNDAVLAVLAQIADVRPAVAAVPRPGAVQALAAASKAAEAAGALIEPVAALKSATELADLNARIQAGVTLAQTASTSAEQAAKAAAVAANAAPTEASRGTAAKTAVAALAAATEAAKAVADLATPVASIAKATTLDDAAKKTIATVTGHLDTVVYKTAAAASGAALAAKDAVSPPLSVTTERDENVLAAIRARITGGAIFFNGAATVVKNAAGTSGSFQSNQFAQASTYLAFEAQPRLWTFDLGWCDKVLESTDAVKVDNCRQAREALIAARGYSRYYVDPFVNARLTAIPVAGASPVSGATIEAPSATFLQSQKAAQLQLGAVSGFNFGRFAIKSSDFHWGLGPIIRVTLQSVTDSQRALRMWDIDNDVFKQWALGGRVTLFERDGYVADSPRRGWAPAAYVDVSFGKFENFETAQGNTDAAKACLRNPGACLVQASGVPDEKQFDIANDTRTYMEGRVFLQYLYLGFDLNTGRGPDDLRFIAGLTVKLDRFITRRN